MRGVTKLSHTFIALQVHLRTFEVGRRIYAHRFYVGKGNLDDIPVLEPAQLLQRLGFLEHTRRQLGDFAEHFAAVSKQADVLVEGV